MTLRKKASQVITPTSFRSRITEAFDPFLLESVGVDENGMTVSVLSTLARLGLDPWEEAGRLAVLPKKAAIAVITRHLSLKGDSLIAARLAEHKFFELAFAGRSNILLRSSTTGMFRTWPRIPPIFSSLAF